MKAKSLVRMERVEQAILLFREQRVMLDADLASLYGVSTKRLNEQVKRNRDRFPPDFMFRLSAEEKAEVVANCDHLSRLRYSPVLPHAFTEHGAIMLASVLNTPRSIKVSIFVVRAFIKLRQLLSTNWELSCRLIELEKRLGSHDEQIRLILNAIKQLLKPIEKPPKKIGFHLREKRASFGRR